MTADGRPTPHVPVDGGSLSVAVDRLAARHGRRHVGLVVAAVTVEGARAVVPSGRLRAPEGPAPRADSLFEIGSVTKTFTALLLAEAVTRGSCRWTPRWATC